MTPRLTVYTVSDEIPPEIEREIRALLESQWSGSDDEPGSGSLVDPALHPLHFVVASGDLVLSYGRTIWARVPYDGKSSITETQARRSSPSLGHAPARA